MKFLLLFYCAVACNLVCGEVRMISLSPAVSDAVVAIGGRENLCGRSSACDAPELCSVPAAGDFGTPNLEAIFKLRPDLIVSDSKRPGPAWGVLTHAGIRVVILPGKRISDFPAGIRRLGVLLDRREAAERVAAQFELETARLRAEIPVRPVRILVLFGVNPVVSCGTESFLTEALELSGAKSVTAETRGTYFTVSPEFILRAAPEAIILAGVPEAAVRDYFRRSEFRQLPAVRAGAFLKVDPDRFCRPGVRLPAALRELKAQLADFSTASRAVVQP